MKNKQGHYVAKIKGSDEAIVVVSTGGEPSLEEVMRALKKHYGVK